MAGKIKKNKGFTMVEVIVVLVILAIVAAFSAPTLMGYVDDVNLKDCQAKERDISKSYIEVLANKGVEKPTTTVDIGAVCDIMTAKGAPSTEVDTYKARYAAKTAAEAKNGVKLNNDASAVLEFTGICTTGGVYKVIFINDSPLLECSQHGYVGNKPEPTASPSTSVLPTPTPEPVTLKSLRATPSSQEYIEGQTFNKSDFTFYASYSDGSEIPIANSEVTLDNTPDLSQITSEPIVMTASYAGVQAKISIMVLAT
ncbi:prepilin-type N-terminal cleavage/methylation domain-containing protein [Eubacterium aggregans]